MELVVPAMDHLPSYVAALETGWSPNNVRDVSGEQLAAIHDNAAGFVAGLSLQGGTITLPDGKAVPKLPFIARWMWDGEFCGSISLRWQKGTDVLPAHVLGHIGYAVVPWKRGRGYASEALRQMLVAAQRIGLRRLEITTDPDNFASRRVIEKNGGRYVDTFVNETFGPERTFAMLSTLMTRNGTGLHEDHPHPRRRREDPIADAQCRHLVRQDDDQHRRG